ncbi:MAG: AraC family transcriptional regulator ligand-binding domain-containing protein [Pseudomonadota bacterium]
MNPGSFPRHYAELLVDACVSRGHGVSKVLSGADIDPAEWAAGTDLTPLQFGRIYQRALWLVGDESFGLLGQGVPNGSFRMLCLCVLYCESFGKAIQRAADFMEVAVGYQYKPIVRPVGERVRIEMRPFETADRAPDDGSGVLQAPHTLLIWINLISWLLGQTLPVERVRLRSAERRRDLHQAFFDCDVVYGAACDAVECPGAVLQWPIVRDEVDLNRFLGDAMPTLLSPRRAATTWHSRVVALLSQSGGNKLPTGADVAHRLHISPATLRRRLSDEGTSLQQIKDQHRCGAAMRYLASTGLPLKEIALRCGFDNPADFNRAFRRWSGQAPGRYRKSVKVAVSE